MKEILRYNLSIIAGLAVGLAASPICKAQQPCLTKAWAAFNNQDYANALSASNECIEDLGARAQRDQNILIDQRTPPPPTGTVTDAEKNSIFARGVLNDVGAAFFIKGRSAEYLFKKTKHAKYAEIARNAYKGAIALPYARTFDPKGWFWSTAEASSDRLHALQPPLPQTRK